MVTVDGDQYYGLLDDNTLVAILIVEFERIQKPEGVYMEVDKSLRGLGLMRYLFNRALDVNGEIYSDTHQTRNARHFWEMLIIYPEPHYKIYIYDTETGDKRRIDHPVGKIEPISKDIWNQQENPILVIVKNPTTVKESLFRKLGN